MAQAVRGVGGENRAPAERAATGGSERRQFLTHNAVVGLGTLVAGLAGFGMQSLAGHRLYAADFGSTFAVITLTTLLVVPGGAYMRLVAWVTIRENARDRAASRARRQAEYQSAVPSSAVRRKRRSESAAMLRSAHRELMIGGTAVAALCALTAPLIGEFMRVPPLYIVVAVAAVPFQVAIPALTGRLQGHQRFTSWTSVNVGLALAKLAGAAAFGYPFGAIGILAGITVGSIATYAVALVLARETQSIAGKPVARSETNRFLLLMLTSSVSISIVLSADVFLVKHYFPARTAGEFAAVAALGKSIYWGVGGIPTVIFPKVAARAARGRRTSGVVLASVALAVAAGLFATGLFTIGSRTALVAFAGHGYARASSYLGWYSLGMVMLGASSVLVNVQQSLARTSVLWVVVPATIARVAVIVLFHDSITIVVQLGNAVILAMLVGLLVQYGIEERRRQRTSVAGEFAAVPIAQFEGGV